MRRYVLVLTALLVACGTSESSEGSAAGSAMSTGADARTGVEARQTARLATKDGAEEISLEYTPETHVAIGDSTTEVAADVKITTTNMSNRAVRAILIDKCSEFGTLRFQIVAQCDLRDVGGGRWEINMSEANACSLIDIPDNVDTTFPSWLVSRRTRSGDDIRCSQEISVVSDGTFLTDPVNGTHNFVFQLN
jgi:hypothetical protein